MLASAYLLEFSYVIKINVAVNYGQNTIELQLVQYIIQYKFILLYVVSEHLYFGLHS
jgi:hypothetical protein